MFRSMIRQAIRFTVGLTWAERRYRRELSIGEGQDLRGEVR